MKKSKAVTPNWIKSFAEIDQNQIFENLIDEDRSTDGTQVYRGSSGKVYLATNHISRGLDFQKLILSEINKRFGPQRHLPEINYLGKYGMGQWVDPFHVSQDGDLDVFEMKTYRTLEPEEWDWEDANDQIALLQNFNLVTPLKVQLSDENIEQVYFKEADDDKRWDWADVVDAMKMVVTFVSENYPNCYVELDTWTDNFALNYKYGQPELILLDVLSVRCENE